MVRIFRSGICATILLALSCAGAPPGGLLGTYRFGDGRVASVRRSVDNTLRYRMYPTGESRRLHPDGQFRFVAGGFAEKTPLELRVTFAVDRDGVASSMCFEYAGGPEQVARRIVRGETVRFANEGAEFYGRLSLPPASGPFPAIVVVHGSGDQPATEFLYNGDFFAAHGVAVLTFDKRGTGRSGGEYTFDFHQLARDVVAAVDYLKSRPDIDAGHIGLSAYSQGGWVAPIAATLSDDIGFILVSCGLIGSPAEEARVETRELLRGRGVEDAALAELDELTRAAVSVIASDFEVGWDELERIERKYGDAPWREKLSGTVVGDFVKYPRWLIRILGRRRAPEALPWYYDSKEVLQKLNIPMVWFVAGEDRMAPNELVLPELRRLINTGKPYEVTVFEGTDHGMLRFREEHGRRIYTGYDPDYYRSEVRAALRLTNLAPRAPDG